LEVADDNIADAAMNLAEAMLLKPAQQLAQRSLLAQPESAASHLALAAVLHRRGHHAEAIRRGQRAAELAPTASTVWRRIAVMQAAAGHYEDAIATLEQRLSISRDSYGELWLRLLQERAGHPLKPMDWDEGDPQWIDRLKAYVQGDMEAAELLYHARQADAPGLVIGHLAEAYFVMGYVAKSRGDVEDAKRYFQTSVNFDVVYYVEHPWSLAELERLGVERPSEE